MILYFASLIMSIATAVMTVLLMNREEGFKYFGDSELYIMLVMSITLLLIGIVRDKGDE